MTFETRYARRGTGRVGHERPLRHSRLLQRPDINTQAFTADGFYRMGDIVRKRGRYVYTEGRKKDLINRGGEKTSCDEVENLIFKLPQVKEVSLVAMPDPVFGEKACACVVLQPGTQLTFEDLIAHLRGQQIASFKLPERLEVMEIVPDQSGRQDPEARTPRNRGRADAREHAHELG